MRNFLLASVIVLVAQNVAALPTPTPNQTPAFDAIKAVAASAFVPDWDNKARRSLAEPRPSTAVIAERSSTCYTCIARRFVSSLLAAGEDEAVRMPKRTEDSGGSGKMQRDAKNYCATCVRSEGGLADIVAAAAEPVERRGGAAIEEELELRGHIAADRRGHITVDRRGSGLEEELELRGHIAADRRGHIAADKRGHITVDRRGSGLNSEKAVEVEIQ